ncbi:hypothetical protein [Leptolyngbya sp. FACHB-17]|uniref:hypothetical protein n=1 Tax=unclassified Leptolyngbya TaxID=2650499 RepID=UPI0019CAA1A6|nr:hypothetical protein [Leptolyngbya sp. FACHB-17]MBD2079499.1 hypothetical protein [Leptolyngbya sp. FACHB-17]
MANRKPTQPSRRQPVQVRSHSFWELCTRGRHGHDRGMGHSGAQAWASSLGISGRAA